MEGAQVKWKNSVLTAPNGGANTNTTPQQPTVPLFQLRESFQAFVLRL